MSLDFLAKSKQNAQNINNGGATNIPKPPVGSHNIPKPPTGKPGMPKPPANNIGVPKPPIPKGKLNIPKAPVAATSKAETKDPIEEKKNVFKIPTKDVSKEETVKVETPKAEENKETSVKDTEVKEEVATVSKEIEEKDVNNETAPVKEKKKSTKKKSSKKEIKEDEYADLPIDIPTTEMTYNEAISALTVNASDEEWDKIEKESMERYQSINLDPDMAPAALKSAITSLIALNDSLLPAFVQAKSVWEQIADKDNGQLALTKYSNYTGANEGERKSNAINAARHFNKDGKNINLYEILYIASYRYSYLNELMNKVNTKLFAAQSLLKNN